MLERIGYGDTNISHQDLFAFLHDDALFVCTETEDDSLLSFLDFFWRGALPNFHVIKNATYFVGNLHSWGHVRRGGRRAWRGRRLAPSLRSILFTQVLCFIPLFLPQYLPACLANPEILDLLLLQSSQSSFSTLQIFIHKAASWWSLSCLKQERSPAFWRCYFINTARCTFHMVMKSRHI